MADIYWGLAVVGVVSGGMFWLGKRLSAKRSKRASTLLAAFPVIGMVVYVLWLRDNFALARWLPVSNLIVVSNLFPPAVAMLAGIAWTHCPFPRLRRKLFTTAALGLIGGYAVIEPLLGRPPECADEWNQGVCLQTSDKSCSAACAATLLRAHGIKATEAEMAELCFTRDGTTWMGLYHGLKVKAAGTPWDVELFEGDIHLLNELGSRPAILIVGLDRHANRDSPYVQEWGWTPGVSHSVLFYGFRRRGSRAMIGDPSFGRELWTRGDLLTLWHGRGVRLVPRQ